jgi:hypothetical protein
MTVILKGRNFSSSLLTWVVGRAVAQAVSRWLPTAAARFRSSWICGGQSGAEQVTSEYFGFPCQSSFHQLLHNHPHLSSGAGTIGQKWPQYKGLSPTPLAIKKTWVVLFTKRHWTTIRLNGLASTRVLISSYSSVSKRIFWIFIFCPGSRRRPFVYNILKFFFTRHYIVRIFRKEISMAFPPRRILHRGLAYEYFLFSTIVHLWIMFFRTLAYWKLKRELVMHLGVGVHVCACVRACA